MDILKLLGRTEFMFTRDIEAHDGYLSEVIRGSKFLVIGAAGSIGQALTKEIFKRDPLLLHAVDISENNLVELVRDLRSSLGYISGEFKTFAIDCGGVEFEALMKEYGSYDYVFNLSALKHVRSEKDPFTLMRMIKVNILNPLKVINSLNKNTLKNYFCISTDKAANPVNMMGASKKIMEMFLTREAASINITMARFANVAFSDGSLLHGFQQRISKKQPLSAPSDVRRYFLAPSEAGELCLLAGLLGQNHDIFFPKLSKELDLKTFSEIAEDFLRAQKLEPYLCQTEEEARSFSKTLTAKGKWPCYFFHSDTSGEKDFEEFYTENEVLDFKRFESIGAIKNSVDFSNSQLDNFISQINALQDRRVWAKREILEVFFEILPYFQHLETGKYLDAKM